MEIIVVKVNERGWGVHIVLGYAGLCLQFAGHQGERYCALNPTAPSR